MSEQAARYWRRMNILAVLVMLLGYGLVSWGLNDMKAHRKAASTASGAPAAKTQGTPGLVQGGLGVLVMAGGLVFAAVSGSRLQRLKSADIHHTQERRH